MGHTFLKKEFGFVPRVAWLVDSFGHSISNARLYSEIGFDSLFISRLDHLDSENRDRKKELNYLWRPSKTHFGNRDQIFVNFFSNTYCWIDGFYVDENGISEDKKDNAPFQSDISIPESYNADTQATRLINYV